MIVVHLYFEIEGFIVKRFLIRIIKFYQKYISFLKGGPTCRFTPTCSAYAVEAFQKRGFFVGFGLTVWRILRCNPFGKWGYDPVPEKKSRSSPKKIPKYQRGVEENTEEHNETPNK